MKPNIESASHKLSLHVSKTNPLYRKNILRNKVNNRPQSKRHSYSDKEQLHNLLYTLKAVRSGNFAVRIPLLKEGIIGEMGEALNDIIEMNENITNELVRVQKFVGQEGNVTGRICIDNVKGGWMTMVNSLNALIEDLVHPTLDITRVITAIARGDLSQKMILEIDGRPLKGKFSHIGATVNSLIDQLSSFASEVTRLTKDVGSDGKLGGQANVPGASGTWKGLTDNVNQLAANLTAQVRAIAEVSTGVTKGDFTRSITVEAQGEVAALKNNINQMIANLKETTEKNNEQNWLKTNLAKFSSMMQGQRSISAVAQLIMSELTPLVGAQYGTFFIVEEEGEEARLRLIASYAFTVRKNVTSHYKFKEGLVGQCAFEKKKIYITNVPDNYIYFASSLGEAKPLRTIVLPVLFEGELKAVIELASFQQFSQNHLNFLDQLMDSIGVVFNVISSTMRTEELLQELKRSNAELEAQANELEEKAKLLELKNQEVELASRSLEEKAEQLSLTSKYKSEFLANMSHELRTPLNSLLILSKTLAENKDKNLTRDQVKFANTVHSAGTDLLALINEILDLSKVEAGKMPVEPREIKLADIQEYIDQTFRPVAEHKGLKFEIETAIHLPKKMFTDYNRLRQILKNLLSNAFKFTEKGQVVLKLSAVNKIYKFSMESLNQAGRVIAFSVVDTGIGIPRGKQKLIFEAFQQADGTTNRKYGGTGLGLTISREIARLLGGFIEVESTPQKGSTFTLFLPQNYAVAPNSIEQENSNLIPSIPPLPETADFTGKSILLVDDDMRNIYAITRVLENFGMRTIYADNGKIGIQLLQEHPDVDLILMDVMMPEMDGLEATSEIRKLQKFQNLPIISLTAKAMKGDREKMFAAGASDYITKPVDPKKLLSLMHIWLNKSKQLNDIARGI